MPRERRSAACHSPRDAPAAARMACQPGRCEGTVLKRIAGTCVARVAAEVESDLRQELMPAMDAFADSV